MTVYNSLPIPPEYLADKMDNRIPNWRGNNWDGSIMVLHPDTRQAYTIEAGDRLGTLTIDGEIYFSSSWL